MKTVAACLAVAALLGALAAVPASAAARSGPEPVARASGISLGFVTRPLIDRTLSAARTVRLSRVRYRRLADDLADLKQFYDYYSARQRAKRFCQVFQAAFGYPRRGYFVGNTVVSYSYDACSEYYG